MVEGGPIDVLTGDYLAELTMLILWKARQKDPAAGYARSVLAPARAGARHLPGSRHQDRHQRRRPEPGRAGRAAGRAGRTARACTRRSPTSTGDDLLPRLAELPRPGTPWPTWTPASRWPRPPASRSRPTPTWAAGASPRRWTPARTSWSAAGSPTPRSSSGPAAWWHGWARDDWDALAGAVAAGHVIECGPQAHRRQLLVPRRAPRPRATPASRSPRSPTTAPA